MFCRNCGKKLEISAQYCKECGIKIKSQSSLGAEETQGLIFKKRRSKKETAVYIVVLLLVLGLSRGAVLFFSGDYFVVQRNMKRAEEAYAAGDLISAKEYYHIVLERDKTRPEAYLKLAKIDMKENPGEAVKILTEGIANTGDVEGATELLTPGLKEAYRLIVDSYMEEYEYYKALDVVNEGIVVLGVDSFRVKRMDIYNRLIDQAIGNNMYEEAIAITDIAIKQTGDDSYNERKADAYGMMAFEICLKKAPGPIASEDFYQAQDILAQGYEETHYERLLYNVSELYNMYINDVLEEKDYEKAFSLSQECYDLLGNDNFRKSDLEKIYVSWAKDLIEQENYEEAKLVLEEGLVKTDFYYTVAEKLEEVMNFLDE